MMFVRPKEYKLGSKSASSIPVGILIILALVAFIGVRNNDSYALMTEEESSAGAGLLKGSSSNGPDPTNQGRKLIGGASKGPSLFMQALGASYFHLESDTKQIKFPKTAKTVMID